MALPAGVGGFLGLKAESVYGTAVTVDQFLEVNSAQLKKVKNTAQGRGLANGLFQPRGSRRVVTTKAGGGTPKRRARRGPRRLREPAREPRRGGGASCDSRQQAPRPSGLGAFDGSAKRAEGEIGRASCRERVSSPV